MTLKKRMTIMLNPCVSIPKIIIQNFNLNFFDVLIILTTAYILCLTSASFQFLEPNSDDEYSDWNEEEDQINCLFCEQKETGISKICEHMNLTHKFDFEEITKEFSFFQKVQLINYSRRQTKDHKCLFCGLFFEEIEKLGLHMNESNHFKPPHGDVYQRTE